VILNCRAAACYRQKLKMRFASRAFGFICILDLPRERQARTRQSEQSGKQSERRFPTRHSLNADRVRRIVERLREAENFAVRSPRESGRNNHRHTRSNW